MQVLVDQFLDYVSLERGLSANTQAAYRADLEQWTRHLRAQGTRSLNEVTREQLVDYLLAEKERGLQTSSLYRHLVSIKLFLRYLVQEGLLPRDVTEVMDTPRLWKALPDTLTPREVDRLLAAPDMTTPLGRRDRSILETLYATGLRVSELCALTLDQLHPEAGYIRCIGKGNKERVVPIGRVALGHLASYNDEVRAGLLRPGDDRTRTVYLTRRGQPFTRQGLWGMIKQQALRAGIGKRVSPHTLRHSFASHLLAHGAPLRIIQEMLGHADIATTQQYTHIDSNRLKAIHHQFHPRS